MQIQATSIQDYLSKIPEDRQEIFGKLISVINDHIPEGFENNISYGMVGWSVPLTTYPEGYHCTKNTPLPLMNLASQKNFIAFYHVGLYAKPDLLNWFVAEFPKYSKRKLDMGKSCVRFKNMDDIPLALIGELCTKMTVQEWISIYESQYKK